MHVRITEREGSVFCDVALPEIVIAHCMWEPSDMADDASVLRTNGKLCGHSSQFPQKLIISIIKQFSVNKSKLAFTNNHY
jgi:hypothetical protein